MDPREPLTVADMVGASEWARLAAILTRPDAPHVLLIGSAGTGKSTALRLILGSTITLWIRCTQESNLKDTRERIKAIAQRQATESKLNWIVMEHADALHADAQAFLRRIMETTTCSTRFILETRSSAPITDPLISRSIIFNVSERLPFEIRSELQNRSSCTDTQLLNKIAIESGGNLRWAIQQALSLNNKGHAYNSLIDPVFATMRPPVTWESVMEIVELTRKTGSAPSEVAKYFMGASINMDVWERSGGACPWTLLIQELMKSIHP